MERLPRKLPVRLTLVIIAAMFIETTMFAGALGGVAPADSVIAAFLGIIGAAIGGDTWRPSGMVKSDAAKE